jgi:DNA-binding CsgD family transcriptional regulator
VREVHESAVTSNLFFKRAIEAVAHIADDTPPWHDILTTARDLIGADSGTLIMMDGCGNLLGLNQVGLDDDAVATYSAHYYKLDAMAEAAVRVPAGVCLDSNELFSAAELQRTEFYTDYQRKHGHEQSLALVLEQNAQRRTGFSFQRSTVIQGAKDRMLEGDTGRYIHALQAALVHRHESAALQLMSVEETLAALGEASCLVTPWGTVVRHSPLASQMFDNRQGLCVRQGRLWHASRDVRALLATKLIGTIRSGSPSRLTVPQAQRETLSLDITIANPRFRLGDERLAFVRLRRQIAVANTDESELAAIFGVTTGEAKVLAAMVTGLTPLEIAVHHAVSESTVRKQIASLKMKMNCSRAVDLVRLALLAQR